MDLPKPSGAGLASRKQNSVDMGGGSNSFSMNSSNKGGMGGGTHTATTDSDSRSRSLTSGTTGGPSSEMTPTQEYFLSELETTDSGSIGLVLRAIYDGGDVDKFIQALQKKINYWDKDIEKLCSYHYEGFMDSIHELMQLRSQCQELRDDVDETHDHLAESSSSFVAKVKTIVSYRKKQRNIASAVDTISLCLPMLEKYTKLQEQMEQKRYYAALRTLEQLELTFLPQVERHRFAQKLMTSVSHIREEIKDASNSEFTDFLENIRKVSGKIGEKELKNTLEQYDMDSAASKKQRVEKQKIITHRLLQSPARTLDGSASQENGHSSAGGNRNGAADSSYFSDDGDMSAQDMVDFGPVYRCLHIFTVLGAKDTFVRNYQKQRREQATIVFKAVERMHGRPEDYLGYFHQIIGFFIVENSIMRNEPSLVTRAYRDELWELALQQVTKTLNMHFGNCTEAPMMLKIRKLILVFALCLKGYGFSVGSFYTQLKNFRDQYNEILMKECCMNFEQILRDDNYTPMSVSTEREYRDVLDRFPFYQRGFEHESFPKKFPFSEFVPSIYEQEQTYIKGCLLFMEHLGLSQSQVDDTVRRYTNVLLERLSGSLKSFVSNRNLALVQLVQITINMGYLEKSCEALETFISKLTIGDTAAGMMSNTSGHMVRLKEDVFRDARAEVEQKIDDALASKIMEFLGLAQYDWEMTSSVGRASDYISDLVTFLSTTFRSFTNLPLVLARHTCLQACKSLSQSLMGLITSPNFKTLSNGALEQFSLDVMQCELFAAQCPVPGYEDGTLGMVFADLRQLLDLFLDSDWTSYLADYGKAQSKYSRLPPGTVIIVLEKIMELERKKNSLFGKGKDKDRKKLLETVLKNLRALTNNSHSHS